MIIIELTQDNKFSMKNIISFGQLCILSLSVALISCSGDDESETEIEDLFLDRFNNTFWEAQNPWYYSNAQLNGEYWHFNRGNDFFIRRAEDYFYTDLNRSIVACYQIQEGESCIGHHPAVISNDDLTTDATLSITKHTRDTLWYEYRPSSEDYRVPFAMTYKFVAINDNTINHSYDRGYGPSNEDRTLIKIDGPNVVCEEWIQNSACD